MNPSTAILEVLAHTPKTAIPNDLVMMTIHVTRKPDLVVSRNFENDPIVNEYSDILDQTGDVTHVDKIMLVAQSIIDPKSYNVVLYPKAASYWLSVELVSVEDFRLTPDCFLH